MVRLGPVADVLQPVDHLAAMSERSTMPRVILIGKPIGGTMMSIEANRRDALFGAAATGLVTSAFATPLAAQTTGTVATATEADYKRDPTRWGSADMAAKFPGFRHLDMRTSGAVIRLRHGGSGPPLLLVHGNPRKARPGRISRMGCGGM